MLQFLAQPTVKMEVVYSSEASINIYQTTQLHIAKGGNICVHRRRRNFKSHIVRCHSFMTRLKQQL
jgi:hypothetical protein